MSTLPPTALPDTATRSNGLLPVVAKESFSFVGIVTPNGVLTQVNGAALQASGLQRREVIGRYLPDTYWWSNSPEEQTRLAEAIRAAAGGESVSYEAKLRLGPQHRAVVDFTLTPAVGESGEVEYLLPTALDLTERRQAEHVLQVSEERYRTLVAATTSIVWTTDAQGAFVEPQPSWHAYTGQSWEAHRGFGWVEAVHPDDRAHLLTTWRRCVAGGRQYEVHGRLWHAASGSYRHFVCRAAPCRDGGVVREWIGTVADIDRQRRAEQNLKASEERFRALCTSAPLSIFQTDISGRCTYQSPQWRLITGHAPEHALGYGWLQAVHPEDRPRLFEGWEFAARNGVRWEREFRVMNADGEARWVHALASPIIDGGPESQGYVGTMEDITERKWAEGELQKYRQGLERMVAERTAQLRDLYLRLQTVREEEKAALARELHDELGATLTVLNLDVQWLTERLARSPELAGKAAAVGELLTRAVQTTRRIQTKLRPAVLDDLGLGAALAWQARDFERHTGIRCHLSVDESVSLDPAVATALFRIVQEALTNVAKHSRASEVRVRLRGIAGKIELEVADNGIGLGAAPAEKAATFGIRGMTERARFLGGSLDVIEREGGGTVVRAALPLQHDRTAAPQS